MSKWRTQRGRGKSAMRSRSGTARRKAHGGSSIGISSSSSSLEHPILSDKRHAAEQVDVATNQFTEATKTNNTLHAILVSANLARAKRVLAEAEAALEAACARGEVEQEKCPVASFPPLTLAEAQAAFDEAEKDAAETAKAPKRTYDDEDRAIMAQSALVIAGHRLAAVVARASEVVQFGGGAARNNQAGRRAKRGVVVLSARRPFRRATARSLGRWW
jgi:hypothetical protein